MSEFTELLSLVGLVDFFDELTDENELNRTNYLQEGKRILSLARVKEKRNLFKTDSLTVRLCNLKFPFLANHEYQIYLQIEHAIKKLIKKRLKTVHSEECLIKEGIPFILSFSKDCPGFRIYPAEGLSGSTLAKDVSGSQNIIALTIEEETFYVPCTSQKRFQNDDYHYKYNPNFRIHMLHADTAFFALWGISWLNQLRKEALGDTMVFEALKYILRNISGCLMKKRWDGDNLPEWFAAFLADNSYIFDNKTNCYTLSADHGQSPKSENTKTAYHSEIIPEPPAESPAQLSDFIPDIINLVSLVYNGNLISAKDLLRKTDSRVYFYLPYHYEKFILSSLQYFISNVQDIKEEEKHRKELDGMVARAYMTKRNIPQHVLKEMQCSELNKYFGFIEFDEEVDLKSVDLVTKEFQKLNHQIFHDFKNHNVALRFRKLGRHHASGLYYPSINTMVVDFRHPDSFIHEYFHMLDDTLGDLSLQCTFDKIALRYQKLLRNAVEEEKNTGMILLSARGKYGINYYLRKCEIFARCGEIYLFRILHIVSSLLKPEETKSFAYPDDDTLNSLIHHYYSSLLDQLKDIKIDKRKEHYETALHIAAQ